MKEANKCNGRCKTCNLLGECPEDTIMCDSCSNEIEHGHGILVETEEVRNGRSYKIDITVCRECYEKYYLSENLEDLIY